MFEQQSDVRKQPDVRPRNAGFGSEALEGGDLREGETTKKIEHLTAKTPSITFLALAGAAMVGALGLFLSGKREAGIFVGLWPLAMLSIGNYNKLVKLHGSDQGELA